MKKKFNNSGYMMSLTVIVLIVVSFIIVGCIAIVMANWNMKRTERNIQSNYYSTESALADIKAGVEMACAEDIKSVYTVLMSSLNSVPYDALNDEFKELYVEKVSYRYANVKSVLESYLTSGVELESEPRLDLSALDNDKIYLRNVGVSYKSANGVYLSRIYTDLEVQIPKIYDSMRADNITKTDFSDYALIADSFLKLHDTQSVNGSVYAGDNGIEVNGGGSSQVLLQSDRVVTRGNIIVNAPNLLRLDGTEVYAKNIVVQNLLGNDKSYVQGKSALDIRASMYIEQDTLLNAKNCNVLMSGGYYGYRSGSSAFCINRSNIDVDLTGLETLWIAGTSYISTPTVDDNADILMGESLTYKGTQSLYLVPSICIIDSETGETLANPVTSDYITDGRCTVDITRNRLNGGVDLAKYVDSDNPYRTVFVKDASTGASGRVYLYLNFRTSVQASMYSDEYADYNKDYMNDRAKAYGVGNILLSPSSSLRTAGNSLTYDGTTVTVHSRVVSDESGFMEYKDSYYTSKCNSLVSTLNEHEAVERNDSLFNYLIKRSAIEGDATSSCPESDTFDSHGVVFYEGNADGNKVLIANGDVTIKRGFSGLVVATGDIKVQSGVAVTGLVISGGTIDTGNNMCEFSASKNGVYPVLQLLYQWEGRFELSKYFNIIETGSEVEADVFNVEDTVVYRNWVAE